MIKLTRLQQLERENKDLKIQNQNLKKKNQFLEDQIINMEKSYDQKFEMMNKRLDALYSDLSKANTRIKDLEEENKELKKIIVQKDKQINDLNHTVANLTARIKKDSSNSSKPSSTDGFKKQIHNSREKSGKKPGGQNGHKGECLKLFGNPTEKIECKDKNCSCGGHIKYYPEPISVKQKVDIDVSVNIKEYQRFEGICEKCQKTHVSKFPDNIVNTVTYGDNLKTLVTMLINEGMVSINRVSDLIKSLTDDVIHLSEGTIVNFNYELAKKCEPIVDKIKDILIKSNVLHVDESGLRINGKLNWIHTACDEENTLYMTHEKRGKEAAEDMGILSYFVGTLIHDHLKSYYKYTAMEHGECNAHILRYLKGIIDIFKREEAESLIKLLIEANSAKKTTILNGRQSFSEEEIAEYEGKYLDLLNNWKGKYFADIKSSKDAKYHNDERCLLERMIEYKDEHLRFIKDFSVPFDNNMAERSLRMIKAKCKISGGFRSDKGAEAFSKIRSVIGTIKKRGKNVFKSIKSVFQNQNIVLNE
jgi:transposase-like protein